MQVPFAGRMVNVNSPSSQQFDLRGDSGEASAVTIAWEPQGREAFEVEVRARIMGNDGGVDEFPIVRWKTETGAGQAVWKEPFETPNGTTLNVPGFAVPARGMVWRNGARQFRISFFNAGTASGSSFGQATLQVTILPVWAGLVDTYPYADSRAVVTLTGTPFPMTAREWRLMDLRGLPLAPAAVTLAFIGVNGAPFAGGDASLFGDWQPIPFEAAAWAADTPGVYVAYR